MQANYSANSAVQRDRLLQHLKTHGSISTVESRHQLDVVQPAARIHELRHNYGHNIVTVSVNAENPGGGTHRFARYILKDGKYQAKTRMQQ
jgi:hypothetical protein